MFNIYCCIIVVLLLYYCCIIVVLFVYYLCMFNTWSVLTSLAHCQYVACCCGLFLWYYLWWVWSQFCTRYRSLQDRRQSPSRTT